MSLPTPKGWTGTDRRSILAAVSKHFLQRDESLGDSGRPARVSTFFNVADVVAQGALGRSATAMTAIHGRGTDRRSRGAGSDPLPLEHLPCFK